MSFLLFHLASIFIISQSTVADLDFFSTDDFNAPFLPIPDYQEPIPSEDIFQNPTFNEDPFLNPDPSADYHSETILFNDNPVNIDLISSSSSCLEEKNLPSKLRSRRDATCPSEPIVPDLSNLLNTINLEPTPETYVITNPIDRAESLEIAQLYCSPFTSLPRLFILPVCSTPSSVYTPVMGGYYTKIKYSKLRESMFIYF
jgi:hypothetical protein